MRFVLSFFLLALLASFFPNRVMARDGLCGTEDNVASVVKSEGLDLLFVGGSATKGESAVVYASSDSSKFIVTIEYPDEVCIVFSGTDYFHVVDEPARASEPEIESPLASSLEIKHFGELCLTHVTEKSFVNSRKENSLESLLSDVLTPPPIFLNFKDDHYVFEISINQDDENGMPTTGSFTCVIDRQGSNPFIPESAQIRYWTNP